MTRRRQIYEGKAKVLFEGPEPGTLIAYYKDDAKTEGARKVGTLVARVCLERNIEKVVFDRNGYLYHGRVKALADAAREAGLKF